MSDNDLARGEAVARRLFGESRFIKTRLEAPENHRRDLLRTADEVIFGREYTRSGLELEQRSLCTIAALTVLGQRDQLAAHVSGALNIGIPFESIAEVIRQMAFYGGFPAALNAMQIADECYQTASRQTNLGDS